MDILSVRNQIKREGINFKSLPLRVYRCGFLKQHRGSVDRSFADKIYKT